MLTTASVLTRNVVRRERTVGELRRLSEAMGGWLTRRRLADCDANGTYIGRHKTQLDTIERVLKRAAEQLAKDADTLGADGDPGAFADDCRAIDIATVWLQRLWEFYRERFDQRDDKELGPVLQAADEVIWSCYHEVMQDRSPAAHGAAPLAVIASQYSPSALESDQPLRGDLRLTVDFPGWDEDLKKLVSALPLPLIALPPWCVHAPWWLIYLAHEVGHHVQDKLSLIAHFREGIGKTAQASAEPDSAAWSAWSAEIFADVFSVLAVGRWAAWSVAEVERSTLDKMRVTRNKYPSPLLRVLLLQSTAKCIGLEVPEAVADFDMQAADIQKHCAVANAVAKFAVGPVPDGRLLPKVLGLPGQEPGKLSFEERAAYWRGGLQATDTPAPAATLPTARHVIAGATAAWYDVSQITDAQQRLEASDALRRATVAALRASGPKDTRGELQAEAPDVGELFAIGLRRCGRRASVQ